MEKPRSSSLSLRRRRFDALLVGCLCLFAFTSLVMEPYFVFGIDYARSGDPFAAGWQLYATRWDPAFLDRPLFLRIMCGIDLFVFGPYYLVAAWAFARGRDWIRIPALMQASALLYSTLVYFAWEFIGERGRADLLLVVVCNVPYSIVALLVAYRLRRARPFSVEAELVPLRASAPPAEEEPAALDRRARQV